MFLLNTNIYPYSSEFFHFLCFVAFKNLGPSNPPQTKRKVNLLSYTETVSKFFQEYQRDSLSENIGKLIVRGYIMDTYLTKRQLFHEQSENPFRHN